MKILKIILIIVLVFMFAEMISRRAMPGDVTIIDNQTKRRVWLSETLESTRKGKRFRPNLDLTVYNAWISHYPKLALRTNAFGLRGDEINPGSNDEYRIMIVGDSITWAGYSPEEDTYTYQLQEMLNRTKGMKVRTINAGIGDVGIEEEATFVREFFDRIRPQMVIIAFYLNDSRPPFGFESEKDLWWARFLLKSRFIGFLYSNVRIQLYLMKHNILGKGYRYRWFHLSKNLKWKADREYFKELVREANLDWGAAWEEDSWGAVEKNIRELNRFSLEKGVKFIVICLPVSFQVYSDFLDDTPQKRIRAIAEKENILFLDLLPKLRQENKINLFYDHCHLNAEGQNIVAQELYHFLIRDELF